MKRRTLLVIQGHAGMEPHIERHFPFWSQWDLDLLGIDRVDGKVRWPAGLPSVSIGKSTYIDRENGNMNRILVESFKWCLEMPDRCGYTDFMMIDYDAVIIRQPPTHPGGFGSFLSAYCPDSWGTRSTRCFGTPWWLDRPSAERFVEKGEEMLTAGEYDNGAPDCYCGLILDRTGIPFVPVASFHANTLDMRLPSVLFRCRDAVNSGAWIIHGFRDSKHLEFVLGKIPITDVENVLVEQ